VTQIKLTEQHVEGFIAAQKDMSALVERMQAAASPDKPFSTFQPDLRFNPSLRRLPASMDSRASPNTRRLPRSSVVMAAIDPQTKAFTDPSMAIKKEIDDVTADGTIPDHEKKSLLEELNEALKSAQRIEFPDNIELVRKYYERIDAALG
jgi:hypothetical protein